MSSTRSRVPRRLAASKTVPDPRSFTRTPGGEDLISEEAQFVKQRRPEGRHLFGVGGLR